MNLRPAAVLDARPESPPRAVRVPPAVASGRSLSPRVVLPALFVLAAVVHTLASLGHLTPAIFTDELLHSKLAQSFADGHPFAIRGAHFLFPAPLPALLQAPAWLFGSVPAGYAAAKILNAVVMSTAVFPAFWLTRRFARPSHALLAAALVVASPAMLYHSYLLSESLGYPFFFLAVGVMVHALARPSHRFGAAVLAVSLLAVATRTQFAVLPLAYTVGALAGGRRGLRLHSVPLAGFAVLAAIVLGTRGAALGPYLGATELQYGAGDVVHWIGATTVLLPFSAGWLVVPGAVLGLGLLLVRPLRRGDREAGAFLLALGALVLLEVGLVAAGDAGRPLERYAIYLPPLAAVLFFAYVERGAPGRRAYAALALVGGMAAWLVPFPSLADYRFSFDSPTLSAYGMLAVWVGHANAATVFAAGALAASFLVAAVGLRGRAAPAVAAVSLLPLALIGAAAYAGDHAMTRRAEASWSASPPDWLDRNGLGRADFLALPYAPAYFGWTLEAWNRDFGRPVRLEVDDPRTDPFAASHASVRSDGTLLVDGEPAPAGLLVVNDFGTRIDLEGSVVARPRTGLTEYRVPAGPRVGSLAEGLYADEWAASRLRYRAWPVRTGPQGRYVVELELPADLPARSVVATVAGSRPRVFRLEPGARTRIELPAPLRSGAVPGLTLEADGASVVDGDTADPRVVAFKVVQLEYEPGPASGIQS